MKLTFGRAILEAFGFGLVAAVLFVMGSYVMAVALTRGRFGFPGFTYFLRETLWVCITQPLLLLGWLTGSRRTSLLYAKGTPRGTLDAKKRPIVFVHGYTQNRTNFIWLSRALARRGFGPFFGFDYASFRPIEQSARKLHDFVERLLAETGATEVDLICHSLGGVVARAYVDLQGGHVRVRHVVTLGSPHQGIGHAHRVFGASIHDLRPKKDFLMRLGGAEKYATVRYLSIYSLHDNIVFPVAVSRLGERGTDVEVVRQGHFGILFSEEVADHIARALTENGDAKPIVTSRVA
jgi:triacylglycerol lipase